MDIDELKKQSDRSYEIALAKQNALEQARSKMVLAYEGHLFLADPLTINLVRTLSDFHEQFVLLDSKDNPSLINDPKDFLSKLIEKNQEALNQYYQTYVKNRTLR